MEREPDDETFVRSETCVTRFPFVPELRVRVAPKLVPLWEATQRRAGREHIPAPFWAFAWPGGQAVARHVLDNAHLVADRRVLDFAAGGGLAALAAARAGAASVVACDIDPLASIVQQLNAELSGVQISSRKQDLIGEPLLTEFDVVLAGDLCYEWVLSTRLTPWLRELAADGLLVLLGDPGRNYLPKTGLERLADYDVPTSLELESADHARTTVWRVLPD